MELKVGEVKTYKGRKVKCIEDKEPGKGCDLCALFANCRDMKCSKDNRKDKKYTHFENVEDEKSRSCQKKEGSAN